MSLARSTYYYRPRGRGRDDEELIGRIEAICEEFPRYGYRRVKAQLRHDGCPGQIRRDCQCTYGLLGMLAKFRAWLT